MIADLFEAIRAAFPAGVVYFGAEWLDMNDAPPRIVLVPTSDSFAVGAGPSRTSGTPLARRPLMTRRANFRARIWAVGSESDQDEGQQKVLNDLRATEALAHRYLSIVHQLVGGRYTVLSMDWIGQEGQEISQYGRACDVTISTELPVLDSEFPLDVAQLLNATNEHARGRLAPQFLQEDETP